MGYDACTVDEDFCVPAKNVPAALAAVNAAFSGGAHSTLPQGSRYSTLVEAVEDLAAFDCCQDGLSGDFILGSHVERFTACTDELLAVLAAHAYEGAYVRFSGGDGRFFGFRVLDGRLRRETAEYAWSLEPLPAADGPTDALATAEPERATAAAPEHLLAPLTITRDVEQYAQWWAQATNKPAIIEALESITGDGFEVEHALLRLMLEVNEYGQPAFLAVQGLRPGRHCPILDLDPAYDGDGILDGVEAVLNLWTGSPEVKLSVSAYTSCPRAVFAPGAGTDPESALAEIIDTALDLINREIAAGDRFTTTARITAQGRDPREAGHHHLPATA